MKRADTLNREIFKDKTNVTEKDLSSLMLSFVTRKRFNYTFYDVIKNMFCWFSFRNLDKNKQKYKKHILFQKGEDKLASVLDII